MGLKVNDGGNYITIYQGKFSMRVPDNTPDAVQRVNKLGKTVFEKYYDSFTGKLVSIKTQDGDYGKSWLFSFKDGKEIYHLQLSYSNSFATAFLKMLPNVDVTKEMKVSPQQKMDSDGKNKSSLFINQDGMTIKHAYTKDAPNGMPDMEQVMIKGELIWDDTKRLQFLEAMVNEKIVPKLEGLGSTETTTPEVSTNSEKGNFDKIDGPDENDEDEIPF